MYKKATFVSNSNLNQYGKLTVTTNQTKKSLKCPSKKSETQIQQQTNFTYDRRALILKSGLLTTTVSSLLLLKPQSIQAEEIKLTVPIEKLSGLQASQLRNQFIKNAESELKKVLTYEDAPLAMKLMFNDAGTYDYETETGGMNGSIVLNEELQRPENSGLGPILEKLKQAKSKIDEKNTSNGQGPSSWSDVIVLGAKVAVSKSWGKIKFDKSETAEGANLIVSSFGATWPVRVGRMDAMEPDPANRIPNKDASPQQIKEYLLNLGAKKDGGFAYKPPFYERPGFVLFTAAQEDPEASEAYLASDPGFAPWKKKYDISRKTITRTDYEVDFIEYFTRLSNLGAKYDPKAYLRDIVVQSKRL